MWTKYLFPNTTELQEICFRTANNYIYSFIPLFSVCHIEGCYGDTRVMGSHSYSMVDHCNNPYITFLFCSLCWDLQVASELSIKVMTMSWHRDIRATSTRFKSYFIPCFCYFDLDDFSRYSDICHNKQVHGCFQAYFG